MGNKSKIKWRVIWIAYLILVSPIAVPLMLLHYSMFFCSLLVERIGAFKEHLIRTYKPEDLE